MSSINELIDAAIVETIGSKRALTYRAVASNHSWPQAQHQIYKVGEPEPDSTSQSPMHVPLSEQALKIRDYVRQPLPRRTVVYYQANMVDQYEPNKTDYLSNEQRARLHELGNTAQADQHSQSARNFV